MSFKQMRRPSSAAETVTAFAELAASAVTIQGGRSTRRDALRYIGQTLLFAALCSIVPCFVSFSVGQSTEKMASFYFGDDAIIDPAIYRDPSAAAPEKDIERLASAPFGYQYNVEFGVEPLGAGPTKGLERALVFYACGVLLPYAVVFWSLFQPRGWRINTLYLGVVILSVVLMVNRMTRVLDMYADHGTAEGTATLRGQAMVVFLVSLTLFQMMALSESAATTSQKCKAVGIYLLGSIFLTVVIVAYQTILLSAFFAADATMRTKFLIRTFGHTLVKKLTLVIYWRIVCLVVEIGALENTSVAFLVYAPPLVLLTMMGRVLQASSDDLLLSVTLEGGAILAEMLEARDLLRLTLPDEKLELTMKEVSVTLSAAAQRTRSLSRSISRKVTPEVLAAPDEREGSDPSDTQSDGDIEADDNSEASTCAEHEADDESGFAIHEDAVVETDDDDSVETRLRVDFCAHTLICTQISEAMSIFASTLLYLFLRPVNTGPPGSEAIGAGAILTNCAVMLLGEALISDAFVAALSRSNILSGVKVDLPHAWKTRDRFAYGALFVIISFTPSMVLTYVPTPMCFTATDRSDSIHDYMLSGCPLAMGPAVDEHGELNRAYLNMTAGAW